MSEIKETKGIQLSAGALAYFKKSLAAKPGVLGVRLGVKNAGCSGLSYVLGFAETQTEDDEMFESQGVKVIVDKKSLPYLEGMEVDCLEEGLNLSLKFHNPNVKSSCGCGESFNVEK